MSSTAGIQSETCHTPIFYIATIYTLRHLQVAMADWFYGKDNTQHGPISDADIRQKITTGEIDQSTIIWREGMSDWLPLNQVPEFAPTSAPTSAPTTNPVAPQPGAASPYTAPQTNAGLPPYSGPVAPTDGLSIAALVCGIISLVACYVWALFGIPAVICGHMSLKKIKTAHTPVQGKGMAIAGLICGYLGILIQLVMIVFIVIAFTAAANAPTPSPTPYSP